MKNRHILSAMMLTVLFIASVRYRMRSMAVDQIDLPLLVLSMGVVWFQAFAEGRL